MSLLLLFGGVSSVTVSTATSWTVITLSITQAPVQKLSSWNTYVSAGTKTKATSWTQTAAVQKNQSLSWNTASAFVTKTFSYEGLVNGVAITTSNSSFDSITASGTITASQPGTAFHGSRVGNISLSGTNNYVWQSWNWTPKNAYGSMRAYVYFGSYPPGNVGMLLMRTSDYSIQVGVNAAGQIFTTAGGSGSYLLQAGTWYRLEAQLHWGNSSVGWAEVRLFLGDSTTLLDSFVVSNIAISTSGALFGAASYNNASTTQTIYLDDVAFTDDSWLGPSITSVSKIVAITWNVSGVTTGVTNTKSVSYNVSARLSTSKSVTWSLRSGLTTPKSTSWSTRSTLQAVVSTSYGVKAAVTRTQSTAYSVRKIVSQSLSTTFNQSAKLLVTRSTAWSQNASVGIASVRATSWAIAGLATAQISTSFGARASLTVSRPTTYSLRVRATITVPVTYGVRNLLLGATRSTSYNVRTIVPVKSTSTTWNLLVRTESFTESFSGGLYGAVHGFGVSPSSLVWVSTQGTANVSGGRLLLSGGPLNGTVDQAFVKTASVYDLRSSYLFAKVEIAGTAVAAMNLTGSAKYISYIVRYNNIQAFIGFSNGSQIFSQTLTRPAAIASGPVFVRVREASGVVYFDYSADSINWVNWTSASYPIASYAITLQSTTDPSYPADGVYYDNVNVSQATKSLSTTYNVRSRVSATKATTYNVRSRVSTTKATTYNVRARVFSTFVAAWNVEFLGNVLVSLPTSYSVRVAATMSKSTTWGQRVRVSGQTNTAWAQRVRVNAQASSAWSQRAVTVTSVATGWSQRVRAASSVATGWSTAKLVAAVSGTSWGVRTGLTDQIGTSWAQRTRVAASIQTSYSVRQPATLNVVGTSWGVRARTTASTITIWNISYETRTAASVLLRWSVRQTAANSAPTLWKIRQTVVDSAFTQWKIRQSVADQAVTAWSTRQRADQTVSTEWSLDGFFAVTLHTGWRVGGKLDRAIATSWSEFTRVHDAIDLEWAILDWNFVSTGRVYGSGTTRVISSSAKTIGLSSTGSTRRVGGTET